MATLFDTISTLTNKKLKGLLLEIKEIGKQEAPANYKKSKALSELFAIEKHPGRSWSDKYSNIQNVVNFEVVKRFTDGGIN